MITRALELRDGTRLRFREANAVLLLRGVAQSETWTDATEQTETWTNATQQSETWTNR